MTLCREWQRGFDFEYLPDGPFSFLQLSSANLDLDGIFSTMPPELTHIQVLIESE